MDQLGVVILLLFGVTILALFSERFKFPFTIVLVLAGLMVSWIPGLPLIKPQPELIFLIFLPPLLYSATWAISWQEFKKNLRSISLAAIGLVLLTTFATGFVVHFLVPGLGWAPAFLLGAILSPTDSLTATAIIKKLDLHPGMITILEGESLVNDASGLIVYRYALAAVVSGTFDGYKAGIDFLYSAGVGMGIGLLIAFLMYTAHKNFVWNATIEVTLTLLTPFACYLLAEHFGASGILAIVTSGLYLSYRSSEMFTYESRIEAYAFWNTITFILNGIVFVLLGLQLPYVLKGVLHGSQNHLTLSSLIAYGLVISLTVLIIRFIWVLPALINPKLTSMKMEDKSFDWKYLVVFAFSGIRGVLSMAAAFAIPFSYHKGLPFPHRELIIFLTFSVVLFSMIVQGLCLPWLIRSLRITSYSILADEYTTRMKVITAAIDYIETHLSLSDEEVLSRLKSKYELRYEHIQRTQLPEKPFNTSSISKGLFNKYNDTQIEVLEVERKVLGQLHREGLAKTQVIRKIEHELDLEQARLNMEEF